MPFEIYLSPPHMTGKEQAYLQEAFSSNWIAPLGPHVDAFEEEMAAYLGKGLHAAALSSGTAAIHLALNILGVGPGDLVLCSDLTFIASASPIVYLGAEPVFVDCDRESWNMSVQALRSALTDLKKRNRIPKAAVLVGLYGQSADLDPLMELCREYDIPVVEDAAESLGSSYRGGKSGSFGDLSLLSFNGNKIITTSGGGMLLSRNADWIRRARFLATQARDPARHYQHSVLGYNYRLSNLLAGVGRAQLTALEERVAERRRVFARYEQALGALPGVGFMPEAGYGKATRWLTVMTLDPTVTPVTPMDVVARLETRHIEARPVWKPLHLQPVFEKCAFYAHEPGKALSEQLFAEGVCLPSGSNLDEASQRKILGELAALLGER